MNKLNARHSAGAGPQRLIPGDKLRGADKLARIPVKVRPGRHRLAKPDWLKIKLPNPAQREQVRSLLRASSLHTVCEEAACPNLPECFGNGTATFMIMGDVCTRRCPFCEVAHGRPLPLDEDEPGRLAEAVSRMGLQYVVITSVDRDDLRDGGAGHFAACVAAVRAARPGIGVEVLVPDFRGRMETALARLGAAPPDVFNHNIETVPRLYRQVRPGADYDWSLRLLREYRAQQPQVPTKSGLMLGLGESREELITTMKQLREHGCEMLTLGQYLQPSRDHLPVERYLTPAEFTELADIGKALGFSHVASGPLVRSSYHADRQARSLIEAAGAPPPRAGAPAAD